MRFDSTDTPEFERSRWVSYWTPVREVIYFKRHVYARALHELGALAFPTGCRRIRTGGRSDCASVPPSQNRDVIVECTLRCARLKAA